MPGNWRRYCMLLLQTVFLKKEKEKEKKIDSGPLKV